MHWESSIFLYFSLICTINAIKVELNNVLKSSLITKASTTMLSLSKNPLRKQGRWEVILVELVLHSIQCSEWAGGPCPDANDGSVCWNVQQFKPGWGSGCVYVGVYDGSVSWKVQNVQMFKICCLGVCVCVCVCADGGSVCLETPFSGEPSPPSPWPTPKCDPLPSETYMQPICAKFLCKNWSTKW